MPGKKARRRVVGATHSWLNRFRKLLVCYEKLGRSFIGLNHLAAAIIAFRKVPLKINMPMNNSQDDTSSGRLPLWKRGIEGDFLYLARLKSLLPLMALP